MPEPVAGWLFDTASLTRRLQDACPGRFSVDRLRQRYERPLHTEMRRLGMPLGRFALIREVLLLCDERPWVFARTILPLSTLQGRARRLAHLGTRPLGATLFADPRVKRNGMEIARLRPGHYLFRLAAARLERAPEQLWGRRSVFYIEGRPLLVNEFFLPELVACD